ncbi:MAG: redoxin domain-containing protein [Chloroflexi bacterium]|nr:redoxin domain-containing protein [Chloroflexota bacterium]
MKSKRMWLAIAGLVPLLALIGLLGWGLARTGGKGGLLINSQLGEVTIRQGPARPFSLTLMDGRPLALEELKGKVVMVDFWASWCIPCRQEAPELEKAYQKYRQRGVEFVGVAIWDSRSEVLRFMQKYGVDYPVALDEKGVAAIDYGVTGIPEKYFISRDGRLLRKFIGPSSEGQLSSVLDELLARP